MRPRDNFWEFQSFKSLDKEPDGLIDFLVIAEGIRWKVFGLLYLGSKWCLESAFAQKLANIHFFSEECISQIEISSCVCRCNAVCGSIRTNQVFATVQGAHLKLQCVLIKLEAHWSCVQNSSTHH